MKTKRKLSRSTKTIFALFATVILGMFAGLVVLAQQSAVQSIVEFTLDAGTVVYDNAYSPVRLEEDTTVLRDISGQYTLLSTQGDIALGAHTMAYNGDTLRVFGGGYQITSTGEVITITDDTEITDMDDGSFVKLADRRYVMLASEISDESQIVQAEGYLFIVMDMVGNALMYCDTMSLKTTQPTTVSSTSMAFDIAQELLSLGGQVLDMTRLFGTTNTYDSGIYKTIEDEQTPDTIEVSIEGGDGGTGGTGGIGGEGGTGGDGGTGGNAGDGGDGGDGGKGGSGGDGGDGGVGGSGGTGGDGGLGEDVETVSIASIRSATSTTSTTLSVSYAYSDPFAVLGIVYLELHDVADLTFTPEGGNADVTLTISDLYSGSNEYATEYWTNYEANARRVSVNAYESDYTFSGLDAGHQYYVVMAHEITYAPSEDGETSSGLLNSSSTLIRILDDYLKVSTINAANAMSITSVTTNSIEVYLTLESVDVADDGTLYVVPVLYDGNLRLDTELTTSNVSTAASGGLSVTLTFENIEDISKMEQIQVLLMKFYDDTAIDDETLLTATATNPFYVAVSSSTDDVT